MLNMDTLLTEKEEIKNLSCNKKLVLFVCTGNTCRSPMCSALFNDKFGREYHSDSAGLFTDGSPITENAKAALFDFGVKPTAENNFADYISKPVTEELMKKAETVVGVSSSHAMQLIMLFPLYASKITSLPHDIKDPFGGSVEKYKECLLDISMALGEMFPGGET